MFPQFFAVIISALVLLLTWFFNPVSCQSSASSFSFYSSAAECPLTNSVANYKFDSSSFECFQCPGANQIQSAADSSLCACGTGYQTVYAYNPAATTSATSLAIETISVSCTDCVLQSKAAWKDGTACTACDATTGATLSTTTRDCTCPTGYVLVETDSAGQKLSNGKQCIKCASGFVNSNNIYACITCADKLMTYNNGTGKCDCPTSYLSDTLQTSCLQSATVNTIQSAFPSSSAQTITYFDVVQTEYSSTYTHTISSSYIYYALYLKCAAQCIDGQNEQSCQCLANLCAMQLYNSASLACQVLNNIISQVLLGAHGLGGGSSTTGWKVGLPFIQYIDGTVLTDSSALSMTVNLNSANLVSTSSTNIGTLSFYLSAYTVNGTYLGLQSLTTQLQLCGGNPAIQVSFLKFGTDFENTCNINLADLFYWNNINHQQFIITKNGIQSNPIYNDTIFYDMYIVDNNNQLFPVPVKILNLLQNGNRINNPGGQENFDPTSMILNNRFFLVDSSSGKTNTASEQPSIIQYAKNIRLTISMQSGSHNQIYPPYLTIEYEQRQATFISEGGDFATGFASFKVEYLNSSSNIDQAALGLFITAIMLSVILTVRRMCVWSRKNQKGGRCDLDIPIFIRSVFFYFFILGELLFILLCIVSWYAFIFFKGQETIYFLLPGNGSNDYSRFRQVLVVCFVAKLLEVLYKLWCQIRLDVFFVDWEKPKDFNVDTEDKNRTPPLTWTVSAWRKIFAVNKFNELQTVRSVHMTLTVLFIIFLLRGVGLEYLATAQPNLSNLNSNAAPIDAVLQFAVVTFFFLCCVLVQMLFRRVLLYRWYSDPAASFVDLLCSSNIGLVLFDERYHAYYVHGKSARSHADASMEELTLHLLQEQHSLVRERGLEKGKDTYEWYVNETFRSRYISEYVAVAQSHGRQRARLARQGTLARQGAAAAAASHDTETQIRLAQAMLRANNSLNRFVIDFVEKNNTNFPYDIEEHEFWRNFLRFPVSLPQTDNAPNLFFDDPDMTFTNCLLLGMEWDFVLFAILLWGLINFDSGNDVVGALVLIIIDKLLVAIRAHFGKINVIRKTLVDQRFLL